MPKDELQRLRFEDGGFLVLVLAVTIAFFWLTLPFFGAILWGLVAAILFAPVYRRFMVNLKGRRNLAATLVLLLILILVITPALLLGFSVVNEATVLYERLQAGELDVGEVFATLRQSLPPWGQRMLDSYGLTDMEELRRMVGQGVAQGLQGIASQALNVGQGALRLLAALGVMMYLTFFLLRDGDELGAKIKAAAPLRAEVRDSLFDNFVVVVRATMKGTVVVAILQGVVGGLIFWALGIEAPMLWGLVMGFFSLVPAVGTGIVWVPVAIYLLATGSIAEGMTLVFCGLFVIGLIDNLLRPILVGRDTRMPDFVVLIATLAGMQLMGLNGFIVGPMIAALFIAVWKSVTEARAQMNGALSNSESTP